MSSSTGTGKDWRPLPTPEGVSIDLELATLGSRFLALSIDLGLIAITVVVVVVVAVLTFHPAALSLAILTKFLLVNFYFIILELHWNGRTVGKLALGLRVIRRSGGDLRAGDVFARNLVRDIELFLPLMALMQPQAVSAAGPGWVMAISVGWVLMLGLVPFFNRDRLRIGDLVGGTLVVRAPQTVLLPDLADEGVSDRPDRPTYTFSREQLDLYGIRELRVLEEVLRRREQGQVDLALLQRIAQKIRRKIGWTGPVRTIPFLQAFYRAQRGRLEQELLFGRRREQKVSGRLDRKGGRPGLTADS